MKLVIPNTNKEKPSGVVIDFNNIPLVLSKNKGNYLIGCEQNYVTGTTFPDRKKVSGFLITKTLRCSVNENILTIKQKGFGANADKFSAKICDMWVNDSIILTNISKKMYLEKIKNYSGNYIVEYSVNYKDIDVFLKSMVFDNYRIDEDGNGNTTIFFNNDKVIIEPDQELFDKYNEVCTFFTINDDTLKRINGIKKEIKKKKRKRIREKRKKILEKRMAIDREKRLKKEAIKRAKFLQKCIDDERSILREQVKRETEFASKSDKARLLEKQQRLNSKQTKRMKASKRAAKMRRLKKEEEERKAYRQKYYEDAKNNQARLNILHGEYYNGSYKGPNPYFVLGIDWSDVTTVSDSDINSKYKRTSLKWHPDKHHKLQDDNPELYDLYNEKYKMINDAKRVLLEGGDEKELIDSFVEKKSNWMMFNKERTDLFVSINTIK